MTDTLTELIDFEVIVHTTCGSQYLGVIIAADPEFITLNRMDDSTILISRRALVTVEVLADGYDLPMVTI